MNKIESIEEFDQFLASSNEEPLLLFKHSTRCPISTTALREYEAFLDHQGEAGRRHAYLDIIAFRDVSNAVAERSGVRHESPQALLFENGTARWNDSHGRITKESLLAAIAGSAAS